MELFMFGNSSNAKDTCQNASIEDVVWYDLIKQEINHKDMPVDRGEIIIFVIHTAAYGYINTQKYLYVYTCI